MKRAYAVLAGAIVLALGAATISLAATNSNPTPAAGASRATVVSLRHTSLGKILVNSSGHTLYEFTRDRGGKDSCASVHGCTQAWPPLLASGTPSAGSGVKASLLSTTKLANGSRQVTYAGHPLYTYSNDTGPGETSYVGVSSFGGSWYALNASGGAVK